MKTITVQMLLHPWRRSLCFIRLRLFLGNCLFDARIDNENQRNLMGISTNSSLNAMEVLKKIHSTSGEEKNHFNDLCVLVAIRVIYEFWWNRSRNALHNPIAFLFHFWFHFFVVAVFITLKLRNNDIPRPHTPCSVSVKFAVWLNLCTICSLNALFHS